jgi:tetratricopeptide (TPR) repeat protein
MHAYTESLAEAIKTKDNNLKGLVQNGIGDLLEQQGLYEEALRAYQKTNKLYWHNNKDQITSISNEGRSYLLMDEPDSALIIFQHGIELAEKKKDRNGESLLMQNISLAYSQKQEFKQALKAIQRSFKFNTDSAEIIRYYINFGKLYTCLGMKDSASYFYGHIKDKVDKLTNHYLQASTYLALANWEKSRKNYTSAFKYLDKRASSIENIMYDRNRSSVLDIEKKYDFELIKNTHNKQIIRLQSWLLLLSALFVVSGTTFTVYILRRKNQMIAAQQTISTLKAMNQDLSCSISRHNADLHNVVLVQCDIAKKIIRFNQDIEKYESLQTSPIQMIQRINKIFYGEKKIEEQWETILKSINLVRPGFVKQVESAFPNLSTYEFRICVLTYAGFKIQEIAIILNQKPNTIQTRRSSIRRKMGLEAGADIADFLDRYLH